MLLHCKWVNADCILGSIRQLHISFAQENVRSRLCTVKHAESIRLRHKTIMQFLSRVRRNAYFLKAIHKIFRNVCVMYSYMYLIYLYYFHNEMRDTLYPA